MGLTYKDSGVDIHAGYEAVSKISKTIKSTYNNQVLDNFGSFGALFQPDLTEYKIPVFVSSTDGVGTKLLLAIELGIHDTVGIDLVAMCVNDIIALGAKPLFMLDYIAVPKLDPDIVSKIVSGIAKGCNLSECALIGGETAEMRDVYKLGDYDLAGFVVGIIDKSKIIDGSKIKPGDKIIILPSNGCHSNGYSLARKVLKLVNDETKYKKLSKDLLIPTKIYVKEVLSLVKNHKIKGIANITGGGLYENIARAIPDNTNAVIDYGSWKIPDIFNILQETGNINSKEMFNTFNMGVGMAIIVSSETAKQIEKSNPEYKIIGQIESGEKKVIINGI